MKKVLVLGDSTSSSLGRSSDVWTRVISEKKIWIKDAEIIDTTCPGNTAASSLMSLIINLLSSPFSFKLAVLYIGNCDRITKPYKTNNFSFMNIVSKSIRVSLGYSRPAKYAWNKLSPFEWNSEIDPDLEKSGDIRDFKRNLSWIRRICFIARIKLIVVIPKSNNLFAPGSAKGNFLYYRIIGSYEKWKGQEKSDLYMVLNCDGKQDLESQLRNIKILIANGKSKEMVYCAINNYAISLSDNGKHGAAIKLFESLCLNRSQRIEIFTFNLALIYKRIENNHKFEELLKSSLSLDKRSYRIDSEYSDAVAKVFEKSNYLIDIRSHLYSDFILDHCHLNSTGQIQLADQILNIIINSKLSGANRAKLSIKARNPEIVNGDARDWKEFFGIEVEGRANNNRSSKEILVASGHTSDMFNSVYRNPHQLARQYFISDSDYLLDKYVKFPEIIGSIVLFNLFHRNSGRYNCELFEETQMEVQRLESYFQQIQVEPKGLVLKIFSESEKMIWADEIFSKTCSELEDMLLSEPTSDLRMRLVMQWYFRESLMFGFQSSEDSKFERERFRQIKESLMIAGLLTSNEHLNILNELFKLISSIIRNVPHPSFNQELNQKPDNLYENELALLNSLKVRWRSN